VSFFKVDDHLHAHRKTLRAGVEPMGLWVLAASWSTGERTDGWVPDYVARRLDPQCDDHAAALVAAGLWETAEREGDQGWLFHQWDDHQHTAQYLEERNRRNANRMRHRRAQERAAQASDQQERRVREHTSDTADTVRKPQPNPTTSKHSTTRAAALAESDHFQEFWRTYPKRVGKGAAVKAYAKALDSVGGDALVILDGLRNAVQVWTTAGTEARFIPHPATWLNQGRWADEVTAPGTPQRRVTSAQCNRADCPGAMHEWSDAANLFRCFGA
jgi:hypothetical protein